MTSLLAKKGTAADRLCTVRILIVGNSGCGKTALAHLLATGKPCKGSLRPTVGCNTTVILVDLPWCEDSQQQLQQARQQHAFIELWDVGAHERYRPLRSNFYADISGVIIVCDSTSSRRHGNVSKWAAEVARRSRFVAAMAPEQAAANPGGLPVPCLVIGNKADLRSVGAKDTSGTGLIRGCAAWLGDLLQQFKYRRKLEPPLRPASSSRLSDTGPTFNTISASALQGTIDCSAVTSFFGECVARLGNPSSATKTARRAAAGAQLDSVGHLLRKPPLPVLAYAGSEGPPPPPSTITQASPQHSTASSWVGFSRTASFHSTVSSVSDHGGWERRYGLHSQADAGMDDSDDLV